MISPRIKTLSNLLVVDDEATIGKLLATILQNCGYNCLAVDSVLEARQVLREIPVDLVLTDRDMPGENGLDLIRFIKKQYPDIGVIMVTVIDDISQAREVLDLGVYGYITKPFTHNQVLITVENALRHRRIELENRHYATFLEQEVNQRTESLQNQLNLVQTLVDTIPAPIFYKDTNGVYLGCNRAFEDAVGLPRENIFGRTATEVHGPHIASQLHEEDLELLTIGGDRRKERTLLYPNHSLHHIITHKATFTNSGGQVAGLVGVYLDVTELKNIEQSLRVSERTIRTIMDNLHVGVVMFNGRMETLQLNQQMRTWFPNINVGERSVYLENLLAQLQWNPSGSMGPCDDPRNKPISLSTQQGERMFKVVFSTLHDENEQYSTTIGFFEDVTETLTAERELRQTQKLEAIGQLAAGIAHEINTPIQYIGDNVHFLGDALADLTPILQKAERLLESDRSGQPVNNRLRELESARIQVDVPFLIKEIPVAIEQTLAGVQRVAAIIRAMREFSHPGGDDKIAIDINQALESTITVSRNEWKYVAEMATCLADDLPLLYCLPGELNQVFLNIIVNAAHAIADATDNGLRGKGLITIATKAEHDALEIRISDTGKGIPNAIQERIFDPFFTTKEVGKGTGQGLAIARSVVVDKHQGNLSFTTERGRGTTFIIRLPLHLGSVTAA